MKPEITPAHRELLAHLLEEESFTFGVVPLALAGHHPPGSYEADLRFDWIDPFPAFAHPTDPARLLIGVFTERPERGLIPLLWSHVLPYGEVELNMNSRLALGGG